MKNKNQNTINLYILILFLALVCVISWFRVQALENNLEDNYRTLMKQQAQTDMLLDSVLMTIDNR